ncbi:hypothetical protein QAD02_006508 [Eretmocerus hayati]|uniref:Uncharacterized protein n=1 Tax=Eretmocerus hayati TaxID=131215 RepID=A0ACC2N1W4_9HYME|nr:hypothetical protein QAD02_006508 [Eretmocerus hayati]
MNCLYSIFWMLSYVYLVYGVLARWGDNPDRPIANITEKLKPILNCTVSVMELLSSIIKRKKFVTLWNNIISFDESFGLGKATNPNEVAKGKPPIHRQQMRQAKNYLWCWIFIGACGWMSVNCNGMIAFEEHYVQNMSYMIVYIGHFAAVSKFCGLVSLLGQRFAYLNQLVRQQSDEIHKSNSIIMIKKIETSFQQLMDMSRSLNDMYSFELFFLFTNLLYHVLTNAYFMSFWIIFNSHTWSLKIFLAQFSWMVMFCIQLCSIHLCCEYTSQEANKMARRMFDWHRTIGFDIEEFEPTLHFMTNQLHFSAAGFFGAGLTSLASNTKFIAIYLVVLLQINHT